MEQWPFVALPIADAHGYTPVPATGHRAWMEATPARFARRCLPLVIANQAGWVIHLPSGFRVTWDGRSGPGGLTIEPTDGEPTDGEPTDILADHFGAGVLTFRVPYLFRTPPDVQLLVRGAPNFWVDGAHPLEGVVETDWATATFTMNWRIITPGQPVRFRRGDPFCFLQPISLDLIERAVPTLAPLDAESENAVRYRTWASSRDAFNGSPSRAPSSWQRDYFVGRHRTGEAAPSHRTALRLAGFDGGEQAERVAEQSERCFAPAAGLQLGPPPGPGDEDCLVTDGQGRPHVLNRSAAFVLACCTGRATVAEIASQVQRHFSLPDPPVDLVGQHVGVLAGAGLVVEVTA